MVLESVFTKKTELYTQSLFYGRRLVQVHPFDKRIMIKFDLYFIHISAACSPYFYAMFSGFDETNKSKITLKDVDPLALEILINYVYTSEVEVTEDNVQTLLPAANLMQLSDVKEACCEFLLNQLHPTNCLGIKR